MRTLTNHRLAFLLGLLWILCVAAPAMAEDTEIYVGLGATQSAAKPNVLFILDTSGSMGSIVQGDQYDPTQTYTGTCDPTKLYWNQGTAPPTCGTDQWFPVSAFKCGNEKSLEQLNLDPDGNISSTAAGYIRDYIARWNTSYSDASQYQWTSLTDAGGTPVNDPTYVECKADNGKYGVDDYTVTNQTDVYPSNGTTGPWNSSPDSGGGGWYCSIYCVGGGSGWFKHWCDKNCSGSGGNSNPFSWNNYNNYYTVYSANYLNWYNYDPNVCNDPNKNDHPSAPTCPTRIQAVKQAVKNLVNATSGLNIGMMRYETNVERGNNFGGPVIFPITDMDQSSSVVTDFDNAVDGLTANGNTPLAETMYEAMLYYRGQAPYFGSSSKTFAGQSVPIPSVSGSLNTSGDYQTPIQYQCQKNFIIYLTDGEPTQDGDADSLINPIIANGPTLATGKSCAYSNSDDSTDCLDNLAEYMFKTDSATSDLGNDLPGTQNITTYTLGFDLSGDCSTDPTGPVCLLTTTAKNAGGKFYTVDNYQTLTTAFNSITSEIMAVNTTFTAPAVSVNAFNRVTHRKELYFTIFRPSQFVHWPGNVKEYLLDYQKDANGNKISSVPIILDANGQPAVDPKTGFFASNATSFWTPSSESPDGDNTSLGGAASQIPDDPSTRNVYTYTGTSDMTLSDAVNALDSANANTTSNTTGKLTQTMFNVSMSDSGFVNLVKWARGWDVNDADADGSTTDTRQEMGDPLHAKPVLVTYGGTDASPDITMYAITNDGYLHAINVSTGAEIFAFVPQDQLKNLDTLYNDGVSSTGYSHNYGLDGNIEVWVQDNNGDGVISSSDGDHVYIYFGQRRGGNHYYALDVTDRSNPKLLWTITGGTGDFAQLGDTWSTPTHGVIKVLDGSQLVSKDVLIFGGGYDNNNDTPDQVPPTTDSIGNAIYIVDATTGQRLWWASTTGLTPTPDLQLSSMTNSIPSQVKALDVNGDGFIDRLYVGDMGGRIWRFDIDNTTTSSLSNRITGGVIANLDYSSPSATLTSADDRKFYYAPDVALNYDNSGTPYLSIAIGSGYRAHPLSPTVHDRFYMIRDNNVYNKPASYTAITEADLFDATNVINYTANQTTTLNSDQGWYISLNNVSDNSWQGEKVLARALTFNGYILFTTFTPVVDTSTSADACSPSQGVGRTYMVNVANAAPVQNLDGVGTAADLTRGDRAETLVRTGLPPEVTVVFPAEQGAQPVALVGSEELSLSLTNNPTKTYWFQDNVN